MTLSIIIPYYNANKYTDELLACLDKQINDEVEVVVIDDGSDEPYKTDYSWCKVIRQKNKKCAGARNTGINRSKGDYIQFIDADDMIPDYFIKRLFREINENSFDVCDYSWKSLDNGGVQFNKMVRDKDGHLDNPSVCTRCFSRAYIGENRFNEKKDSTEDEDFSRKLGYLDPTRSHKHTAIGDYMYFYRTSVDNSKIKRFKMGLMNTKRIVYYYSHVKKDMTFLLREIKEADKINEVWLLTNQNDIPELSRYCQISKPGHIWGHELRGEAYSQCEIIKAPITTQIVVYCQHCATVGGIPTFIYNFCLHMREYYDIMVVYEKMDDLQISRLSLLVKTIKYDPKVNITCDTLILNRLTDQIMPNISHKQSIQMCHACKQEAYRIPQNRDLIVNVSQASKDSWGEESARGIVIHNLPNKESKKCLILVSGTRAKAKDKGSNDERMRRLAKLLDKAEIKYIWLNFAEETIDNMPTSFVNMPAMGNIQPYIERADYLVQLSDREAYCMSILEALTLGTAVIATPFPSLFEEGFEDGKTGYIIPYDVKFDVRKLLNVPQFKHSDETDEIIKQWRKILGNKKPQHKYTPPRMVSLTCIKEYYDKEIGRMIHTGEIISVNECRANVIIDAGFARKG